MKTLLGNRFVVLEIITHFSLRLLARTPALASHATAAGRLLMMRCNDGWIRELTGKGLERLENRPVPGASAQIAHERAPNLLGRRARVVPEGYYLPMAGLARRYPLFSAKLIIHIFQMRTSTARRLP